MAPHLQLSMIEQANIETSGLSHTFRAQETRARQTDVCENQITLAAGNHATKERVGCTILSDFYAPNQRSEVNVRGYDPSVNEPRVQVSLYSQAGQSGFFLGDRRSSPLGLLLYPLETTPWLLEQHIAGAGFLTDEKGVPIYPFMEANLAGKALLYQSLYSAATRQLAYLKVITHASRWSEDVGGSYRRSHTAHICLPGNFQ
jgi:hypothetical protein